MTVLSSFLVLCSILVVPTAPLSNNRNIARVFGTTSSGRPTTTSQHMALGGNYLDNIDNDENDNTQNGGGGQGNWGIFGPQSGNNNRRGQGGTTNSNNRGSGGGVGTAIRPPNSNSNRGGAPSNYGIGSNRRQQSGSNGVPRVVKIRQPQDLLDFVVEDERLSVGKFLLAHLMHFLVWCMFSLPSQINTNLLYYSHLIKQLKFTRHGVKHVQYSTPDIVN